MTWGWNDQRFADRADAGRYLAAALQAYRGRRPLVLGIPRGGVAIAAEVARGTDGDLDVIVARKLGAPFQEELAIGAVTAHGGRWLNDRLIAELGVDEAYLEQVTAEQADEAARRELR